MADEQLLGEVFMRRGMDRRRMIALIGGLALVPVACGSDADTDAATATTAGGSGSRAVDRDGSCVFEEEQWCPDWSGDPSDTSVDVVRAGLEALLAGDPEGLQRSLAEAVEFHAVSPTGKGIQAITGVREVGDALASAVRADPALIFPVAGGVLVFAQECARGGGAGAAFVEVSEGQVRRIRAATLPGG